MPGGRLNNVPGLQLKRWVPVLLVLFVVLAPQAWGYAPSPLESGIAPVMEQSIYREHTFPTGERTGPLVPWESILYNSNQLVCSRYWRVTEPTGEYFSYVRDTRLGGPLADPNYGASTWTPITRTEVEQGQRLEFLAAVPVMLLYLDSAGAVLEVEAGAGLKAAAVTRPEPCQPTAPKTQLSLPAPKQPVALLPEVAESLAARGATHWNPLNGPGPLGEKLAATFRGASYTELVTSEPTTLYRVYGGKADELGPYWTRTPPAGPLQSQIDSALLPQWGNTAQNVTRIQVPPGTTIYEGVAAAQGGLVGGGNQVFIPHVDAKWIIK